MTAHTVQIDLPDVLLKRAHAQSPLDARDLITFLLERYVQESDKTQRWQAYETYYQTRSAAEIAEESELLAEFSGVDAELDDQLES
jgi:hypothetical protein